MIIEKILPCECHKVNNKGEVLSCIKQFSKKGKVGIQTIKSKEWKILNNTKTKSGYFQCNIHGKIIRVNRLIAFNFISNPFGFSEVHHKNGIKKDNRVDNLEWGNAKMNAKDRDNHGNTARGIKNANAKLNNKKVKEIKKLRKKGLSLNKLAEKFKVSKKLILLIIQNKIWKHV